MKNTIIDPKDVSFVAKNPCIRYCKNSKKITICKTHSYYNQIQMELALTCQSFCDFVFYTNKGMVIDRVEFDESAWNKLSIRVLKFFFNYLLDNIILREEKKNRVSFVQRWHASSTQLTHIMLTHFRRFLYLLKKWKRSF